MELVILAEKKDGKYRIRNFYPNENKNHLEVAIGDTVVVPEVSPFPFENFSSVNNFVPGWKPTYLKVDADITQEEWDSMHHSGIKYHRFPNRKATILGEFNRPFRYARNMLDYFGDELGTYDLTTWVIHEETRTDDEFKAMSSIIEQASKEYSDEFGPYTIYISFDEYTLPYMKQLLDLENVSFGRGKTTSKDPGLLHELSKLVSLDKFSRFLHETVFNSKDYFNAWLNSAYQYDTKRSQLLSNLGRWLYLGTEIDMNDFGTLFGRELAIDMTVDTLLTHLYDTSDLWVIPHPDPKDAFLEEKLRYHYWLAKEEVPLASSVDPIDYYSDSMYYDDDVDSDDEFNYAPDIPEDESYDERLEWISALEKQLQGYATLDEIKARLPMTHPKLWEDYENYK